MQLPELCIRRPVMTTLLMAAFLIRRMAYGLLTVLGVLLLMLPVMLSRLASLGGGFLFPLATTLGIAGFVIEYLAWTIGFGAVALTSAFSVFGLMMMLPALLRRYRWRLGFGQEHAAVHHCRAGHAHARHGAAGRPGPVCHGRGRARGVARAEGRICVPELSTAGQSDGFGKRHAAVGIGRPARCLLLLPLRRNSRAGLAAGDLFGRPRVDRSTPP